MCPVANDNCIFGLRGVFHRVCCDTTSLGTGGLNIQIVADVNAGRALPTLAIGVVTGVNTVTILTVHINTGAIPGDDKDRVIRRIGPVRADTVNIFTIIGGILRLRANRQVVPKNNARTARCTVLNNGNRVLKSFSAGSINR